MQTYRDIKEVVEFIRPFPEPEDVFAGQIDKHAEHLLPLVSVNLGMINNDWEGWIHFVSPIEPYDGCVGEDTQPFHNYYTRENYISFKLKDNRYEFNGDFQYFFLENDEGSNFVREAYASHREDLKKHYTKTRQNFQKSKNQYKEYGALFHQFSEVGQDGKLKDEDRMNFIDEINGEPYFGNWSCDGVPIESHESNDEDGRECLLAYPLTEDDRKFHYIGSLAAFDYFEGGADGLLLFYDPQEKIALITFDWT